LDLLVDSAEMTRRRAGWQQPTPPPGNGMLAKYARLVGSASTGALVGATPTD